jgi:hypothetical protein
VPATVKNPESFMDYDWEKFRELSGLTKNDETLEHYYDKLMLMCSEVIDRTESTMNQLNSDGLDGDNGFSELASKELISAAKIIVDKDGETLTYDKARKIMKRIEVMRRLREDILKIPDLSEKLDGLSRPISSSLPPWYLPDHDFPLLHAVAKWGLLRGDLIIQDKSFPFYDLHMEHIKSNGLDKEDGVLPQDLVAGKMEERFWIRDHALLKRIEYFCDQLGKKVTKRGPRRTKKRAIQWTPVDTDSDIEDVPTPPAATVPGPKLKLKLNISKEALESESKLIAKQERRKKRKEKESASKKYEDSTPVSDDTDAMLEDVENRISRRSRTYKTTSTRSNSVDPDEGSSSTIPTPSLMSTPAIKPIMKVESEIVQEEEEIIIQPPSITRPPSFTSIASLVNEDAAGHVNVLGKRDSSLLHSEEEVKRQKLLEQE